METVSIYKVHETGTDTERGYGERDFDKNKNKIPHRKNLSLEVGSIASGNGEEAFEGRASIEVFADGACEPNPGPGAWAFVVYREGREEHFASGVDLDTTNNRMELTAALRALEWITANCPGAAPRLHSDSSYTVDGCNQWRHRWKARGWKKGNEYMPNADLWRLLDAALEQRPLRLTWVRGHAGNTGNERADAIASQALRASILAEIAKDPPKNKAPVLMFPNEVINLKTAEHIAGRDRRTVCQMIELYGLGHQVGKNAPWRISAPALILFVHGDMEALEALRSGDREHPNVARAIDHAARVKLMRP